VRRIGLRTAVDELSFLKVPGTFKSGVISASYVEVHASVRSSWGQAARSVWNRR
jgi:hypothetical protein